MNSLTNISCTMDLSSLSGSAPADRTVIVGAGIVGSCLAHILATHPGKDRIILIDRDVEGLPGSTGHAPGYVGQYNQIPALTELAVRTVRKYLDIPGGFSTVGGLEIAQSDQGAQSLERRCSAAKRAGLSAEMISTHTAVEKAPFFVRKPEGGEGRGALWFHNDGTANAQHIARHEQQQARSKGALLLNADICAIEANNTLHTLVLKDGSRIEAGKVVVCAGIWTRNLLGSLPVVPVAHPYAYTASRGPRSLKTPFVRYPEAHVYVRDHGTQDGIGSYAHDPIAVANASLTSSAYGAWHTAFEPVLQDALSLLPDQTARQFEVSPKSAGAERVFNGIFSVTPDGMPLVGQVGQGLFVASAVWVTHAAASAQLVADILTGQLKQEDQWLAKELDPLRFTGKDASTLERTALGTYNDIYNKNASISH
ncbi:related to N,N-dimethylglycine oxidase [Moesziomyces antarcticus]|uniref:Related to N,N-dimethylglycine oxidase n=3 Tax=Pseudozyma antarctica TaxID=84753 RepID=A0A5C3FY93_PSEA2|nr:related to N,N-dimethylglycine oxidase [Moesziomyces antarcticus]